jgi:resuscitation-promoting factor RpfB
VPGRKHTLSPSRSLIRTSTSRFALALSVPALALAGIAASGGLSASTASGPARQVRVVSAARPSTHAVTLSSARGSAADGGATLAAISATALHHRNSLSPAKEVAWHMMQRRFGWRPRNQFRFLNRLWERESSWNKYASNPYSGAYGIPQAVPGSKMASAGRNWRTSASVQIRWGLRYIRARYGTPRGAWYHECADGWY